MKASILLFFSLIFILSTLGIVTLTWFKLFFLTAVDVLSEKLKMQIRFFFLYDCIISSNGNIHHVLCNFFFHSSKILPDIFGVFGHCGNNKVLGFEQLLAAQCVRVMTVELKRIRLGCICTWAFSGKNTAALRCSGQQPPTPPCQMRKKHSHFSLQI